MQQTFPCPKCGAQNIIGERACQSCSAALQYGCPQCNTSIDAKFTACPKCGATLNWPIQEQKKPSPPGKKEAVQNSTDEAQGETSEQRKPGQKKTIYLLTVSVSLIGILFFAGFAISMLLQEPPPTTPLDTPPPPVTEPAQQEIEGIEITVGELLNAYQTDRKAAEAQYKGEILLVTGTVDSIGINLVGIPFVKLAGNSVEAWRIQCIFNKGDDAKLTELERREKITIQGKCDDYLPPDVIMKDCVLIR